MAEPFKRGKFKIGTHLPGIILYVLSIANCSLYYIKFLEMQVTAEEMAEAKVPLNLRDYCAHLFIPLMKCRKDNYYLPWKCKKEKHTWEECQFQE